MTEKEYLLNIRKVRTRLKRLHIPAIEEETGIPDRWLRRVKDKEIDRPDPERIERLVKYLEI